MIARCQKRRRTRIAKGGQVFNEQAIWGNPELPARFYLRISRHCEEGSDEAIRFSLAALDCFASLAMTAL
jgi:hypothetical protein